MGLRKFHDVHARELIPRYVRERAPTPFENARGDNMAQGLLVEESLLHGNLIGSDCDLAGDFQERQLATQGEDSPLGKLAGGYGAHGYI